MRFATTFRNLRRSRLGIEGSFTSDFQDSGELRATYNSWDGLGPNLARDGDAAADATVSVAFLSAFLSAIIVARVASSNRLCSVTVWRCLLPATPLHL